MGTVAGTSSVVSGRDDLGGLKERMMSAARSGARERAMRVVEGLDYGFGDGLEFGG